MVSAGGDLNVYSDADEIELSINGRAAGRSSSAPKSLV
jgi:hypothetical protein